MSGKGGRTSTSWDAGSSWRTGKTKTIRVPEALADRIMDYARELDQGIDRRMNINIAVTQGNRQEIILEAIADYIALRREKRHPNQHSKTLDTQARTWDELRKFEKMVEQQPEKLGVKQSSSE